MNDQIKFDWKISRSMAMAAMGSSFKQFSDILINDNIPELADLFPFRGKYYSESHIGNGWILLYMEDRPGEGIPSGQEMETSRVKELTSKILPFRIRNYEDTFNILGNKWFGFNKFIYTTPYSDSHGSTAHAGQYMIDWFDRLVIPEVLRRNEARFRRAMPQVSNDLADSDESTQQRKKMLGIKQKRLNILGEQAAKFGIHCPPHILMEMDELREEIRDLLR